MDVPDEHRCGSTRTLSGKPCRTISWFGVCNRHREPLTPEQIAERAAEGRARAERKRYPACWSWPVPALPPRPDTTDEELLGQWVYNCLVEFQGDLCAACGRDRRWDSQADHCHKTGLVRGFLCAGCNISEGRSDDLWAENYRRLPPAVILGMTTEYVGRMDGDPLPWVIAALKSYRPTDPVEAAGWLADAANLPSDAEWFMEARAAGINTTALGDPFESNCRIADHLGRILTGTPTTKAEMIALRGGGPNAKVWDDVVGKFVPVAELTGLVDSRDDSLHPSRFFDRRDEAS